MRSSLRFSFLLVAISAFACLASASAEATVIVSNLGEPIRSATPIADPMYWAAQAFYTDADYQLSTVLAKMGNATGTPDAQFELRLSDGSGEIDLTLGGLLTAFTVPDLTGALADRTFTPESAVTLLATEKYWFVVGTHSEGFDWAYADNDLWTGPGSLGDFGDSSDAGATFTYHTESFPYFIEVNGEAVPEPGTFQLMALGLVALCCQRQRRAR